MPAERISWIKHLLQVNVIFHSIIMIATTTNKTWSQSVSQSVLSLSTAKHFIFYLNFRSDLSQGGSQVSLSVMTDKPLFSPAMTRTFLTCCSYCPASVQDVKHSIPEWEKALKGPWTPSSRLFNVERGGRMKDLARWWETKPWGGKAGGRGDWVTDWI